jgi:hypothetical protein
MALYAKIGVSAFCVTRSVRKIHTHVHGTHTSEDNRLETAQQRCDTMGCHTLAGHVKVKIEKPFDTDILRPP